MKLINLIDEIKEGIDINTLLRRELGTDLSELVDLCIVELCMRDLISLESEVKLFNSDSISDMRNFQINGINYVSLLPFDMFLEFVEEAKKLPQFPTSLSIAERFLDYIENDA
ncbi:hypothetical protein [Spirosoma endophyticum]|uniref:Uncharacterized protein n=1 Tax=Spirosoma endophyticum TaxID=662367 RepID=A0A1I2IK56_9BACT|nr:hypothetical protein [Spirosoma endophyticum]SFF40901.1 hypothetical protein SAMN05216167_1751 [Spirosoma endophyticum]